MLVTAYQNAGCYTAYSPNSEEDTFQIFKLFLCVYETSLRGNREHFLQDRPFKLSLWKFP
jgi:hypothetical protein